MAVLKSKDGNDILIDCQCGCDDGIRLKINKDDCDYYCFMTYTNGCFCRDQEDSVWRVIRKKLRKILAIVRNKDYYCSDIVLTKDEFEEFKEYVDSV